MKVYIEKVGGEFRTVNDYTAWRGFENLGAEIVFFEAQSVETLALDAQTPVVAGIPTIWRALRSLGIVPPVLEPIPRGLESFSGRESGFCTLGEVRARILEERGAIFLKPRAAQGKLFDGHVARVYRDLILTAHLPDEMIVWWSEAVPMRGEFRGFVHDGALVGFRHYAGDFRWPIDFAPVEAALAAWNERPRGCSMDWASTDDGRTLLIEVNDGYALGCYGLASWLYAPLLASRWQEMVESGG